MRKIMFLVILILLLCFSAHAADIYFSLAPTISLENFGLKSKNETINKEESWGFNLKAGFIAGRYISLEVDYDYIDGFKGYFYQDKDLYYTDMQINTVMPMFKTSVGTEKCKNYFSTGIGYMHLDWGEVQTDACWKLGIGFDCFFKERYYLKGDINYIVGFGDVGHVEYYNGSAGVGIIF